MNHASDFTPPPRLAVGTMNFGKRTPEADAVRIVARAMERGLTFFDTANAYNAGESERILGRALGKKRHLARIATKVGFGREGRSARGPEGLSAARIHAAIDESLERLGTDYVDVYYLHVPDHHTPIEESLGAMHDLLVSGKVRAWGISNYASWQILEMNHIADSRGMPRPAIAQQMYNLVVRQLEIEYFAFARRYPIHTTVYNPLAGGLLSGKHVRDGSTKRGSRFDGNTLYERRYWSDKMFDGVDALKPIAEKEGLTLLELAYAWLAGRSDVGSILVGPASVEHLDAAISACERARISPEGERAINDVTRAIQGTDASYVR